MCVILVVDTKRPSTEWVEKAWTQNSHGGGVAWRDGEFVCWEKGLELKDMQEYAKSLPLPHVLHFRIASTGGRSEYLCHPFEVSRGASIKLSGKTKNRVLFHNGTWTGWRHELKEAYIKARLGKLPDGPLNDTRSMALMAYHFGGTMLELINERTVLFGAKDLNIYGEGWEEEGDILMSNTIFLKGFRSERQATVWQQPSQSGAGAAGNSVGGSNGNVQRLADPRKETIHVVSKGERERAAKGGPSLDITFRGSIQVVGRGTHQPKLLEENTQRVLEEASGRSDVKHLSPEHERVLAEWAHGINNKSFSGGTPPAKDENHLKRIDMDEKGIEYLGRM